MHLCLGVCLVATVVPGGRAMFGGIFEDDSTCKGVDGLEDQAACGEGEICMMVGTFLAPVEIIDGLDDRSFDFTHDNTYKCRAVDTANPSSTGLATITNLPLVCALSGETDSDDIIAWLLANPDHTQVLANLLMRNLQGECTLPATKTVVEALGGLST